MPTDRPEPTADDATLEVRAAVDVMFEALSHIQASLETASPDQREASYRRFKEALYDRFEHEIERRREAAAEAAAVDGDMPRGDGASGSVPEPAADEGADDEDDTLEKLWPTVSRK